MLSFTKSACHNSFRKACCGNSAFLNLHHLMASCGGKAIPWILWQLWKARNVFVFERTRLEPTSVVKKAFDEAEIWFAVNSPGEFNSSRLPAEGNEFRAWLPPALPLLKCNIGCSWLDPYRNCGAAWILRNHKGETLFHSRRSFSGVQSRIEAELLSSIWASECLNNLHQKRIIFETSSNTLVDVVSNPSHWPLFRSLCCDIENQF